ncbi:MAG: acyl carrier protein [Planctomycetaceae bacterium]
MENAKSAIREFISNQYALDRPIAEIDETVSLRDAGVIDSVGILPLILFLEERFMIRVEDAEVVPENLDSIARLAEFVNRKVALAVNGS